MLSLPATVRLFLCTQPVDFRRGIDGLAALVHQHLGADPFSGHFFVFRNRRCDRLKILYWDKDGYALWLKRLERGVFVFPKRSVNAATTHGLEISAAELAMLLDGVELDSVRRRPRYRRPQTAAG